MEMLESELFRFQVPTRCPGTVDSHLRPIPLTATGSHLWPIPTNSESTYGESHSPTDACTPYARTQADVDRKEAELRNLTALIKVRLQRA
jgi:hypothetical protein